MPAGRHGGYSEVNSILKGVLEGAKVIREEESVVVGVNM